MSEDLPKAWADIALAEVGVWRGGGTPSKSNSAFWTDGTIPWVSPKDMKQPRLSTAQDHITESAVQSSATNLVSEGSILLVTRSGILAHSLPVATNLVPVTLNQDIKAVTPYPFADSEFLRLSFQCFERDILNNCRKGGTTVHSIEFPALQAFRIPLPPLNEQKRIVAKIEELFSELDAGEESLRRARHQLGIYRQSLLKQAFEGKLTAHWRTQNPDKLESPDQLLARIQAERQARYEQQLKEWEKAVKKWQQGGEKGKRPSKPSEPSIFDRNMIGDHGRIEAPECWAIELAGNCPTDSLIGLVRSATEQHSGPSGFKYIKMDRIDMLGNVNIDADVFVECTEDEARRFALRAGDILFNTRNSVELVGKSGIVRRDPDLPTVYNNNLMRIRLPDCISPIFFGLQLCSQPFRERMERVKKATTSVAAIYAKDFWPLPLVVCSLPEQQEIVRLLDEQFEAIARNEREIDAALKRSKALRQSILKRAFTGHLVPQDPADEPAPTLLARIRTERESASTKAPRKQPAHSTP